MKIILLLLAFGCARILPLPPLSEELKKENVLNISFENDDTQDKSGHENHAMKRDGFYSLPAAGKITQETSAMTMAAWVKLDRNVTSYEDIVALSIHSQTPTTSSRASLRLVTNNRLVGFGRSLDMGAAQEVFAQTNIPLHQWAHLAAVINYRDSTIGLFINGKKVETDGKPLFHTRLTANTPSTYMSIGGEDDGSAGLFQSGVYREVLIWRKALSPEDVEALYQSQKVHFP